MRIPILISCILLFACSSENDKTKKDSVTYYPTYTSQLEDTLRTLELTYIAWACECAEWATKSDLQNNQDQGDKLAEKSIFIEPADSIMELPDTLGYSGDLIRFTGRFYLNKGYPKNYPKTEMHVDKARVFKYTKYEVLRSNYRDFITDTTTNK